MSVTIAVKVTEKTKKYFNDTLNEILKINPDLKTKREALKYLLNVYHDKFKNILNHELDLKKDDPIDETLIAINTQLIKLMELKIYLLQQGKKGENI